MAITGIKLIMPVVMMVGMQVVGCYTKQIISHLQYRPRFVPPMPNNVPMVALWAVQVQIANSSALPLQAIHLLMSLMLLK
ncbi:hypothetical protein CO026_01135 [Candidatus Kaiserbacteria bacterium CG_4_9_14_0_2_um_filter_41_32]|uniref:Uncharacterized protein n=1 Tax=Candidatus Kaiserbacteria bacterium CG_4_9_14_0_2_um_filter_41_32 TaxID=1974601 RepID=A0A2M8FF89_9BACT|nr:MAG: hypothetical protein CO026_01135 [Candidatus Kaiserbacteria bacterium CG_4_9_14_0_2_um_filter_41_32]